MIRRIFWVSVGVGATIYVLNKMSKVNALTAHLTPGGVAQALTGLAESLRDVTGELATNIAANEAAIRDALLAAETEKPAAGAATPDPEEYF